MVPRYDKNNVLTEETQRKRKFMNLRLHYRDKENVSHVLFTNFHRDHLPDFKNHQENTLLNEMDKILQVFEKDETFEIGLYNDKLIIGKK